MNIQSIQNSYTNFKSGYPVVHWVREAGEKKFTPAITSLELNEKLQSAIIRMLNSDVRKAKPEKVGIITKLKQIIQDKDEDFAHNPVARSFYNSQGGWKDGIFEPFGYILTGLHAEHMSDKLGKPIGRAKGAAPRSGNGLADTAEVNIAVNDYVQLGLSYVKKLASHFRNGGKVREVLHTKFEVVRTKTGKKYVLLDAKFCPESGADSPFVKMGYTKS